MPIWFWAPLALVMIAVSGAAQAEPVADFYRGKTISMVVGNPVGND